MLQDKLGGSIKDFKSDVDSFKKCNQEYGIFKREFDEYANFLFKQKGGAGGSVNLESSALIASMGSKTGSCFFWGILQEGTWFGHRP